MSCKPSKAENNTQIIVQITHQLRDVCLSPFHVQLYQPIECSFTPSPPLPRTTQSIHLSPCLSLKFNVWGEQLVKLCFTMSTDLTNVNYTFLSVHHIFTSCARVEEVGWIHHTYTHLYWHIFYIFSPCLLYCMYVGECSQSSSIKNSPQLKVNWTFEDILSPIQNTFSVERHLNTVLVSWILYC